MPDAPHIPGMIKPQTGKKIQMTFDEASRFIANDFFNSMIQHYHMVVGVSNAKYEEAESPLIEDHKYFIKHFKDESKFRIGFTKYHKDNSEPSFRQVEVMYSDILKDILFYKLQNGIQFALRMFDILEHISDEEFEKASKEFAKNTQQHIILK